MTVLVTGAAGFVGAHVVHALAAAFPGERIVATDVMPPDPDVAAFWRTAGSGIVSASWDVTSPDAAHAIVGRERPSLIVHAAALTPLPAEEDRRAARIVAVNVGGAANVLEAALANGVRRVIAFSSGAAYGVDADLPDPIGEEARLRPVTLYGVTKAAVEMIAGQLKGDGSLSTLCVRVSAAYGEMERPTASRRRMSEIHALAHALIDGRPVTVAGPEVRRDWTHADDIGRAVAKLAAATHPTRAVYNVSCGVGRLFAEAVAIFERQGLRARWVDRVEDAEIAVSAALSRPPLDIAALARDTGFAPAFSLEAGIESLLRARDHRGRAP